MVYNRLLDCLVPGRCPACGIAAARGLCAGCRGDLPRLEHACRRCGLGRAAACPLRVGRWHLEAVSSPFRYAEPLQGHVQALKFAGRRNLGWALGELLADHVAPAAGDVDALVPVPLYRRRFLDRGYNQAVEIARPVAAALGLPLWIGGIARCRSTPAQAQLAASERRANVRGAFRVDRDLTGLRIAVIDDVMTTGATVNALALALLRAGARSVLAWTVARSL